MYFLQCVCYLMMPDWSQYPVCCFNNYTPATRIHECRRANNESTKVTHCHSAKLRLIKLFQSINAQKIKIRLFGGPLCVKFWRVGGMLYFYDWKCLYKT